MISFENPVFLLLLIPLGICLAISPLPSRSGNILQLLIDLVLVCALSGMSLRLPDKEGSLYILCDRSLSMPQGAEKSMEKQIRIISRQMKNPPGVISFAGSAQLESPPGKGTFDGFKGVFSNRNSSDLAGALDFTLKMIPRDTPGRILLISDGNWNGASPERAFSAALMRRIKVDHLPLSRSSFNDFAISEISGPLSASPGEYCSIICTVYAPRAATVKLRFRKNNGAWSQRTLALKAGENRLFWRDRNDHAGVSSYDFFLVPPPGDQVKENNSARHLLEVRGRGKILLLTSSPSGNLKKLLLKAHFEVESLQVPSSKLSPEMLGSYRAVILENVPASAISSEVNALMAEMVRQGRMGLFMTGGASSLAVGGWYKTPVGEILPGALEKQHDIRRRRSAVMMALDRSGSMSVTVDGVTKMAMANLAAVESYRLLSPEDEFGLIAVDSSVHRVVPLGKKGKSSDCSQDIMSIESMGGGIFVDKALHDCVEQLLRSKAPVRHILLFADAADAEQPGDYKALLERAVRAGITVSVVGLGKADASDADLLRDIARRGKGKCYFSDNSAELPRIFAEDTFVMVRASFNREKVRFRTTADLTALPGAENVRGILEAGGYNLCFAKEKSRVLLRAMDEEKTPIAMTGYAGLGKTALLGIEVDGEYSGKFASDPHAGNIIAALTRYVLMPRKNSFNGCFVTQSMESGVFKCEILLDPERRRMPFSGTPHLSLLISSGNGKLLSRRVMFNWQGADRLTAESLIPSGGTVNAAVEFGGGEILPLAPAVQSISAEFSRESRRDIAPFIRHTGGICKSSFDNMGELMERQESFCSCRAPLLLLAMLLLLLQVWLRRSGRELPWLSLRLLRFSLEGLHRKSTPQKKKNGKKLSETEENIQKTSPEKREEPEPDGISAALKRAKKR